MWSVSHTPLLVNACCFSSTLWVPVDPCLSCFPCHWDWWIASTLDYTLKLSVSFLGLSVTYSPQPCLIWDCYHIKHLWAQLGTELSVGEFVCCGGCIGIREWEIRLKKETPNNNKQLIINKGSPMSCAGDSSVLAATYKKKIQVKWLPFQDIPTLHECPQNTVKLWPP